MKEKKKMDFKNFEVLSETNGTMIGGFSGIINFNASTSYSPTNKDCHVTNNCNGGNCIAGCGGGTGG